MLRIIISILVFISPVISCEKSIERSGQIESPEMEGYGWQLGDIARVFVYIGIAGAG